MPYLRLTCPSLEAERRREIAEVLTSAVVELFTPPRGPNASDIRDRTTVQFATYSNDELFVGGHAATVDGPDVTVEVSDWFMSVRQRRQVAARLSPLLVELFGADPDAVNVRFHPYPPTDFAVGGRLLADRVPRPAQWAKRLLG